MILHPLFVLTVAAIRFRITLLYSFVALLPVFFPIFVQLVKKSFSSICQILKLCFCSFTCTSFYWMSAQYVRRLQITVVFMYSSINQARGCNSFLNGCASHDLRCIENALWGFFFFCSPNSIARVESKACFQWSAGTPKCQSWNALDKLRHLLLKPIFGAVFAIEKWVIMTLRVFEIITDVKYVSETRHHCCT